MDEIQGERRNRKGKTLFLKEKKRGGGINMDYEGPLPSHLFFFFFLEFRDFCFHFLFTKIIA